MEGDSAQPERSEPSEGSTAPPSDAGPSPATTPDGEPAVIGGYRLDGVITHGSSASVFRAFCDASERPVAIKLMNHPVGAGAEARRAWRDLDLIEQLSLPSIPRLLDQGVHEGRLFLATEFVEGHSLLEHCDARQLDRRQRVELLADLADAVQALHEQGIIHRGIKSANVVVDERQRPILIDLGIVSLGLPIASPREASTTTIACLAPEQVNEDADQFTTRTDVYGLGATGYQLLTGHPPHDLGVEHHEAVRRIAEDPASDPRELAPRFPRQLAAILRCAVSRDPADRYGSAGALARDLRRWLRHEPVSVGGMSAAERLGYTIGRHPVLALLALFGIIAATAAVTALVTR